ncbi:MAG: hypothetical protein ACPGGK_11540 [Pikeienuella sp.]
MVDFRGLANSVAIPVVVVNQSREIVFANRKASADFTRAQAGADIADQFKKSAGLKKSTKKSLSKWFETIS